MEITIDDVEFTSAMKRHFGYTGPPHVLHDVFSSMDDDYSVAPTTPPAPARHPPRVRTTSVIESLVITGGHRL